MREILFRGKCTGEDDIYGWVDGFYVRLRDSYKKRESHRIYTGFAECDCGSFYGDCYEVDPKTVGQFTGLLDKNGERIYEGDIVRSNGGILWLIAFEKNAFVCKDESMKTYFALWEQWEYNWKTEENIPPSDNFEVVGNIHDNPELLR